MRRLPIYGHAAFALQDWMSASYMFPLLQCAKLHLGALPDLHALRTHTFSDNQVNFSNVVIRTSDLRGTIKCNIFPPTKLCLVQKACKHRAAS